MDKTLFWPIWSASLDQSGVATDKISDATIDNAPAMAHEPDSATTKRTIAMQSIEIGMRKMKPAKEKFQPPGTANNLLQEVSMKASLLGIEETMIRLEYVVKP